MESSAASAIVQRDKCFIVTRAGNMGIFQLIRKCEGRRSGGQVVEEEK